MANLASDYYSKKILTPWNTLKISGLSVGVNGVKIFGKFLFELNILQ